MLINNPNNDPKAIEKMKKTKAKTKEERSRKAKLQFLNGERQIPKNNGIGYGGKRKDLNHYVRSCQEANFARLLNYKNIKYEYEKTIPLYGENGKLKYNYCIDFYLPKYDSYIEIKGKWYKIAKEKVNLFRKQHPDKNFIIIEGENYYKIEKLYKSLIPLWENYKQNIKLTPKLYKQGEI